MENDTATSKKVSADNSTMGQDIHNSSDIILILTEMRTTPNILCPTVQGQYHLGDTDVSLSFYAFQMVVMNSQNDLNMEEHVEHILDNLQNIHKTLQEQFSVGASRFAFNKQLLDAMVDIVKRKKTAHVDFQIDLLVLARKSSSINAKIIRSVSTLYICMWMRSYLHFSMTQTKAYCFNAHTVGEKELQPEFNSRLIPCSGQVNSYVNDLHDISMLELCTIRIPSCLVDLLAYLT
ncbi:hypothetical protein G6F62_006157 [Rhizopus arrhizus]|uniref:Uncharacterized protein n=1 Tax=Rhizopus oryzae TaxID=64495 RepID=A0A9P6X264_RHIOR|nr:hypothetical protein G6F23_005752 [Rhizopus arrhizus]KAG0784436.1 hypothetical protein G6F21_009904 [Rhizopus arrhizus]KAG0791151.1 hypothetical protein G6F22_006219 [Rhizopus arrhizus]KAG0807457.1 hypothetical protein G6F20_010345 [Rhizopus arrhizus]KAG0825351.1 hypothetical protein G6F19_009864 [Rhizopus arrhizus]